MNITFAHGAPPNSGIEDLYNRSSSRFRNNQRLICESGATDGSNKGVSSFRVMH